MRLDFTPGVRLQNQRLLRVAGHVLRLQLALVDQGLDEGVVFGDLGQRPVAKQVAPRITDMDQAERLAVEHQGGQGRAHARLLRVVGHRLRDRRIRVIRCSAKEREDIRVARVAVEVLHVLDHQLRGDLARSVAAHAISQHEQVRARIRRILVIAANQAAVGGSDEV